LAEPEIKNMLSRLQGRCGGAGPNVGAAERWYRANRTCWYPHSILTNL